MIHNKKKTDKILLEKAKSIVQLVIKISFNNSKVICDEIEKDNLYTVNDKIFNSICLEIALFYIHFIDRIAFIYIGVKKRNIFMDFLFRLFLDIGSDEYIDDFEKIRFRFIVGEMYNERQAEYGRYKKLFAESDEDYSNTLYWEFGKKIANIVTFEYDLKIIMLIIITISTSILCDSSFFDELFKEFI